MKWNKKKFGQTKTNNNQQKEHKMQNKTKQNKNQNNQKQNKNRTK